MALKRMGPECTLPISKKKKKTAVQNKGGVLISVSHRLAPGMHNVRVDKAAVSQPLGPTLPRKDL